MVWHRMICSFITVVNRLVDGELANKLMADTTGLAMDLTQLIYRIVHEYNLLDQTRLIEVHSVLTNMKKMMKM